MTNYHVVGIAERKILNEYGQVFSRPNYTNKKLVSLLHNGQTKIPYRKAQYHPVFQYHCNIYKKKLSLIKCDIPLSIEIDKFFGGPIVWQMKTKEELHLTRRKFSIKIDSTQQLFHRTYEKPPSRGAHKRQSRILIIVTKYTKYIFLSWEN